MKSIRFALATVAIFLATAVHADTLQNYTYRVKLPAINGMTCAQHATELASAFISANGNLVTNVQGTCQGQQTLENSTVDIIVVSYQAANELRPYRATLTGEQFTADGDNEVFLTYAACMTALPNQVSAFNIETGLTAVAAYCSAVTSSLVHGYTMSIEGFGQPQNQLFGFMPPMNNYIDYTNIFPIAAKLIAGAGGVISYQDSGRIFFYAPKNITVSISDFSTYAGRQCQDQQAIAEIIATNAGVTNVTSLCQPDMSDLRLIVVGLGYSFLNDDYGVSSLDYASYNECVADRARVTAPYGDRLSGALCEPNLTSDGHYQLHIYTKH